MCDVAEVLDKGVYRLKDRDSGAPLKQVNGACLKQYHPREDLPPVQVQSTSARFMVVTYLK